ncbi:LacI family DNA-binding transcriptional regulator [Angustibacter speluncae]
MRPTGQVTLKQVAERAGVSLSTASVVFSGTRPVTDATRERVVAAAADLGWTGPNPLARSLRQGRTGVVGVVLSERLLYAFRDPYSAAVLDGLASALDESASSMLLLPRPPAGEPVEDDVLVQRVAAVDGVVIAGCGLADDPVVAHLHARGVPMVGTGGAPDDRLVRVVVPDRAACAELARHLRDLGHHRVAVLTFPLDLDGGSGPVPPERLQAARVTEARERALGVQDVLGEVPVLEVRSNSEADARDAALTLLDVDPARRPTAIVAGSDVLALGVLAAAEQLGLRVPDDLSVTGFDGIAQPWGQRLTTVVQPGAEKGRVAGELLNTLLAGGEVADVELAATVRLGETTGPAPA